MHNSWPSGSPVFGLATPGLTFGLSISLFAFPILTAAALFAQPSGEHSERVTGFSPMVNGIEIRSGKTREEILALRDDLLRVRMVQGGEFPEDASWAVLANARRRSVTVVAENTANHVGFST